MARTLDQWLRHIEQLHPRSIELGLDRVRRVHAALDHPRPAPLVVTVSGTNGKGSCVAWLEAIARAAGLSTVAYTSPHLQRYNERVRIDSEPVSDDALVTAFERVEAARGDVPLTYFEFGTLAAFLLGRNAATGLAALEVGLGGRLDAVNAIDSDVAVVTSIGLDHCDWLGPDREAIGREKAGIFRKDRPAIVGEHDMPDSIAAAARDCGARLMRVGRDFSFERCDDTWHWRSAVTEWRALPLPAFGGAEQYANAACAIAALEQLAPDLRLQRDHIVSGLNKRLRGRFQVLGGEPEWILDVAHNAEAAATLAAGLERRGAAGRTLAVAGLMRGKPVAAFAGKLAAQVDEWWIAAAANERALPAAECAAEISRAVQVPVHVTSGIEAALASAAGAAQSGDRIVVTGSFLIVGAALDYLSQHDHQTSE